MAVELDRLVAHCREWIVPFLWVSGPEARCDRFDEVLASDPSVTSSRKRSVPIGARTVLEL